MNNESSAMKSSHDVPSKPQYERQNSVVEDQGNNIKSLSCILWYIFTFVICKKNSSTSMIGFVYIDMLTGKLRSIRFCFSFVLITNPKAKKPFENVLAYAPKDYKPIITDEKGKKSWILIFWILDFNFFLIRSKFVLVDKPNFSSNLWPTIGYSRDASDTYSSAGSVAPCQLGYWINEGFVWRQWIDLLWLWLSRNARGVHLSYVTWIHWCARLTKIYYCWLIFFLLNIGV